MLHDDSPETRHVGRTQGTGVRDRLLIVAVLVFLGAALVLSRSQATPDGATAQVTPSASAPAIVTAASPTQTPATPSSPAAVTPSPEGAEIGQWPRSGQDDLWGATACGHRGAVGLTFAYECPPGGIREPIWGDRVYTDDSSVCTAAVHAGVIDGTNGGSVAITIAPGQGGYIGTARNGVTSEPWDRWPGSFRFADPEPGDASCPVAPESASAWVMVACPYRGLDGTVLSYACPPSNVPRPVWGDGIYTDDSSVCSAAVHAGRLNIEEGGRATIAIRPGRTDYPGSAANGMVAPPRPGPWPGSFEVMAPDVSAQPEP